MKDTELQEIEKALQDKALSLEQARISAYEDAMKEIADAKAEEEKRRMAAQEFIHAHELRQKLDKIAKKQAEAEAQKQAREFQILTEQEQNRREAEICAEIVRREAIAKRLADLEHAEEMANKELSDLTIRRASEYVDTERIMPNPLERFFQKEPK